jgi:hypothetical protein
MSGSWSTLFCVIEGWLFEGKESHHLIGSTTFENIRGSRAVAQRAQGFLQGHNVWSFTNSNPVKIIHVGSELQQTSFLFVLNYCYFMQARYHLSMLPKFERLGVHTVLYTNCGAYEVANYISAIIPFLAS